MGEAIAASGGQAGVVIQDPPIMGGSFTLMASTPAGPWGFSVCCRPGADILLVGAVNPHSATGGCGKELCRAAWLHALGGGDDAAIISGAVEGITACPQQGDVGTSHWWDEVRAAWYPVIAQAMREFAERHRGRKTDLTGALGKVAKGTS